MTLVTGMADRLSRWLRRATGRSVRNPSVAALDAGPRADRATYLRLHANARAQQCIEIDRLEQRCGFAVDRAWLDDLALHTQVVLKESRINYQHGRLLYTLLRRRAATAGARSLTILETGTARGFSSLCMARALADAGRFGTILTLDILPHDIAMYWNCIDDHEGPKTRRELLRPWAELCGSIVWMQVDTRTGLHSLGLPPIGFAFLDAVHTFDDVMHEYAAVRPRQGPGDIIVFDDVTPALFPGVVAAVAAIEREGLYAIERIVVDEQRGYAIAIRL